MLRSASTRIRVTVAALCVAAAVACSGDDSSPSTAATDGPPATTVQAAGMAAAPTTAAPATTTPADAAEVDPSATLRVGYLTGPQVLDPHRVPSYPAQLCYIAPVVDNLLTLTPDLQVAPMLATAWEFAADGSYLELTLREGVTFHDGVPFDAEAVRANLDRAKNIEGSTAAGDLATVTTVEVVDAHTVRLHGATAQVPASLAFGAGAMMSPASFGNADIEQNPVGSGPYRLVELTVGDRATYERVDGYWDPSAQLAERLVVIGFNDNDARFNALVTGQLDVMHGKLDHAPTLEAAEAGEFQFHRVDSANRYRVSLNRSVEPLDDVRVRQALNYAVDRQAIADALLGGIAPPAWQIAGPQDLGFDPGLADMYPYDPDEAKRLLAEAGLADGFTLGPVLVQNIAPQNVVAESIQAMFAEVGVTLELEPVDPSPFLGTLAERQPPAAIGATGSRPDPAQMFDRFYLAESYNPGGISEEFRSIAAEAVQPGLPADERGARYQRLNQIAAEEAWEVPIVYVPTIWLAATDVVNLTGITYGQGGSINARYLGIAAG